MLISLVNQRINYINSEGSEDFQTRTAVVITAGASAQAADSMPVSDVIVFSALKPDELMSENLMKAALDSLAQRLLTLRAASIPEDYMGPVLFTGEASAELFNQTLAQEFVAGKGAGGYSFGGSGFGNSGEHYIGRRILPYSVSVTDNPKATTSDGTDLFGSCVADAEGVPALRTTLVDHGVLKTHLSSRSIHDKKATQSNGHAGSGNVPAYTNLIITDSLGKSDDALKSELLDRCKARGLGLRHSHPTIDPLACVQRVAEF